MTTATKDWGPGIAAIERAVAQAYDKPSIRRGALAAVAALGLGIGAGLTHCALAEYGDRDQHNGTSAGGGGDYGHSVDYCGSECGTGTVFLRDGRNGPAWSGNTWHGPTGQAARAGF